MRSLGTGANTNAKKSWGESDPNQIKQNITLGLRKKGFKGFWVNYRSGDDNSLAKTY